MSFMHGVKKVCDYFFLLVISGVFTEPFYCLPIGTYDQALFLYYQVSLSESADQRLIACESLKKSFSSADSFNSLVPFVLSPCQPVLFFDKTGFSFFDQGILKSKYFHFRSPGSVYTEIPFDHTMGIHWYDRNHGLVSILKNNSYVIYDLSLEDGSMNLIVDDSANQQQALFPFTFKETLFYVRDSLSQSEIVSEREGVSKTVFKVQDSKIIDFCFFNEMFGCFGLYKNAQEDPYRAVLDFYFFHYSYETMSFDVSYGFEARIPFIILKSFLKRNLFPWCVQPVCLEEKIYGFKDFEGEMVLEEI